MSMQYILQAVYKGPWLLSKKALKELNAIIDDHLNEWKIVIRTYEDKVHEFESLEEALCSPELASETPISLELFIPDPYYARPFVEITNRWKNSLDINIDRIRDKCEDDAKSKLFYAIKNWAEENKPSVWLRMWDELYGLHFAFIYIGVIAAVIFLKRGLSNPLKSEAAEILDGRIDASEFGSALELLLRTEFKLYEPVLSLSSITLSISILVFSLLLTILLSIKPNTQFEIGKGARSLKRWNLYLRFVFISIPTLVFSGILLPYILELLKNVL